MPEIAEVARIVNYLKKYAVGRTVRAVKTQEDDIVYGKVGTSASAFQKAITGKRIVDARQQGKYFWLVMNSPPHPLMHFGMAGWMKFSNDDTTYYRPTKPAESVWPPKCWKFILQLEEDPGCEIAFVDKRRLGRIRLIDAAAEDMRTTTPLKENGPDPIIDKDILTVDWLAQKLRSKRVPVKALLLDQANISGIGNWVGDEVMYQSRLHPEQYSNTFSDEQIEQLHKAIMYVCDTAVEVNGDSSRFPEHWLMNHRWSKGKTTKFPNGATITFMKVGGRTSAIVPSVQKKTAAVAGDVSDGGGEDEEVVEEEKLKKKKKGKKIIEVKQEEAGITEIPRTVTPKRGRSKKVNDENEDADDIKEEKTPASKKQKLVVVDTPKKGKKPKAEQVSAEPTSGRRRSARFST